MRKLGFVVRGRRFGARFPAARRASRLPRPIFVPESLTFGTRGNFLPARLTPPARGLPQAGDEDGGEVGGGDAVGTVP